MALLFLAGCTLGGVYAYLKWGITGEDEIKRAGVPVQPNERVNVLVLGVDKEGERSDTMILVSIDPQQKKIGALWIPRDTRAKIAGKGTLEKIAHAHAYDTKEMSGTQRSVQTVEDLLGVPVHHYVKVNFKGFVKVIDALGGVDMDVKRRMAYHDPYQDLHIDLAPGFQHLDGQKALWFVRWRESNDGKSGYENGDIGRIETQRQFADALTKKIFSAGTILKLPILATTLSQYVKTDLQPGDMVALASLVSKMNREDIKTGIIPGDDRYIDGISYRVPDPAGMQKVVDDLIRGINRTANSAVRVEVLNGTNVPGLAAKMGDKLKSQGFNVVSVGNAARRNYSATQLLDRSGDEGKVDLVSSAVGRLVSSARLSKNPEAQARVDLTIIVGKDFVR